MEAKIEIGKWKWRIRIKRHHPFDWIKVPNMRERNL